jgi:glycosyltransferase involved in cell wall biosynthesis
MRNELISSDVFILPSRLEGLPRVVIEAISVGLPAVISNVNGNYELIEKDFLVDGFNAEMYANRVELLLNNSSIYDRTSELNFKKSLEYKMEKLEPIRNHFYVKLAEVIKKGEQG